MAGPLTKHKLTGIGAASAHMVLAAAAANPAWAWVVAGVPGKIILWILTQFFSMMASLGLVMLNVGASRIETIVDQTNFTGAMDDADKLIEAIRATGRSMTKEEEAAIDGPVIKAFRKWGGFARKFQ